MTTSEVERVSPDKRGPLHEERKGYVLRNALVFTDFQWVTFHLAEKSPFRTVDLPIELLTAERANRAKSQRSSPYLESNSPGTFAPSRNYPRVLFLWRTLYPPRTP